MPVVEINFAPRQGLSWVIEVEKDVLDDENNLYELAEEAIGKISQEELTQMFLESLNDGFQIYEIEEI